MNFLWESWLKEYTVISDEIVINSVQNKGVDEYRILLSHTFLEVNRVLHSNGWMCVIFHNSSEKVWHALQRAIADAGFEVRGVQTFDKQHGTFKMFVSDNAVGYDLILHCKKRNPYGDTLAELPDATVDNVRAFVRGQFSDLAKYQVHYLHVNRKDEFDYRRLFADWLRSSVAQAKITIDFESFRKVVDELRRENQW